VSCCLLLGLTACTQFHLGERATQINPTENPVVNITNFSDSLSCMDHMLYQLKPEPILITAQDIENHTAEQVPLAGMKDMLISAISRMSERSQRISFVAYGTDIRDILLLHKAHDERDAFEVPDLFLRGGVTQFDKNVLVNRFGGGLSHDNWNMAYSSGQGITYVGLDLNAGTIKDLKILSRAGSSNVLALIDKGFGTEAGGRIKTLGAVFDFGIDRRDGLGQSIRNLVDLGAIEVIGKLLNLPYMTCLPINYKDHDVSASIDREYYRLVATPNHLIKIVQFQLKEMGYYNGTVSGELDKNTLLAIRYARNIFKDDQSKALISLSFYKHLLYNHPFQWPSRYMRGNSEFIWDQQISDKTRKIVK